MDASVLILPAPPATVWVGSYEYTLRGVERGHKRLDGAEGITHYDSREIFYDASRGARQAFDTVWHELTHAINDAYGLVLKSTSKRKNDEAVAKMHGLAWTQVLLDNPALVRWIELCVNLIKSQQENSAA